MFCLVEVIYDYSFDLYVVCWMFMHLASILEKSLDCSLFHIYFSLFDIFMTLDDYLYNSSILQRTSTIIKAFII